LTSALGVDLEALRVVPVEVGGDDLLDLLLRRALDLLVERLGRGRLGVGVDDDQAVVGLDHRRVGVGLVAGPATAAHKERALHWRPMARGERRRSRGGWWRRALLALGVALAAWIGYEAWTWPRATELATRAPRTTAFIERYRATERAAGRDGRVAWSWVPYAAISPHVKRAVLVAEDINFFSHHGFEIDEARRAVARAVEEGELPRGASTITQQLAKNLWLSPSRNPVRKAREAVLTWQLERALAKRRILELYLNVVELGPGVYGVEAASRRYFGKAAADLAPGEAAQLAASLPRPARWHPGARSAAYHAHVARILQRMDRAEFLRRQI